MITFGSPFWLLVLGLLPWLRWLHRFQRQGRPQPTAALFLWRQIHQLEGQAGKAPANPDPRWWLRAAILSLLILNLADPYGLSSSGQTVDVWLDDSLSQFTREGSKTRLQLGLEKLITRIQEIDSHEIRIHSLGNPTLSLTLRPLDDPQWAGRLRRWTDSPRGEPTPPPLALTNKDSLHILLTDGADVDLNRWLEGARDFTIIQTGELRSNSALIGLALRQSLQSPDKTDAYVELINHGSHEVKARLQLIQQGREIHSRLVSLPAGQISRQQLTLVLKRQADLSARLSLSDDPLLADNRLDLPLARERQPIGVATQGNCSTHLEAFISAIPLLETSPQKPDINISCDSTTEPTSATPLLRLRPIDGNRRSLSSGHWFDAELQHIELPRGLRIGRTENDLSGPDEILWAADNIGLIIQRHSPTPVIEVNFDTQSAGLSSSPQYPLLLSALLERLVQRPLSESTLQIKRDIDASRITPLLTSTATPNTRIEPSGQRQRFSEPLLMLALLLLLLDIFLEFRPQRIRAI